MSKFEIGYDPSFLESWGNINLEGYSVLDDKSHNRFQAVLTTPSKVHLYHRFDGVIFCYQDELLEIQQLDNFNKEFYYTIPRSLSEKDIREFVEKKVSEWNQVKFQESVDKISKNFKLLKSYARKNQDSFKEYELKNISKLKKVIEDKMLRTGVLPVLNRKLRYEVLSKNELVHINDELLFVIYDSNEKYHLLRIQEDEKWLEKNAKFLVLLIDLISQEITEMEEDSFQINLLEAIPHPFVVVSKLKEMVFSNKKFLSLNLSLSQVLKSEKTIQVNNNLYQIAHSQFDYEGESFETFVFIQQSFNSQDVNLYNDLGVICSSLAHELKNPLAGILAALNVLEITDDFSDEAYDYIDKMKDSTLRAKKLVETFLGFSKFDMRGAENESVCVFCESAFKQATQLIKERMIETGAEINFSYESHKHFQYQFNESVFLMVFYLLFSENLTHYQHMKLVKKMDKTLSISSQEEQDYIKITISPVIFDISKEKLVNHMLAMQGLKIEMRDDSYFIKSI